MSTIKADNFTWKSGESSGQAGSVVTGAQVVHGVAKSWGYFSVSGSTITVSSSFNTSSMTYNGTGDFTTSYTNAMPSAYYAASGFARVTGNGGFFSGVDNTPFTTTSFRFGVLNASIAWANPAHASYIIHSKNS